MARQFEALVEAAEIVDHPAKSVGGTIAAGPARDPEQHKAAVAAMRLLLATMSQKTLTALSNLVTGAALFSAWWLWSGVLPEPSINQLVGVSLYAMFILAIEFLRRR